MPTSRLIPWWLALASLGGHASLQAAPEPFSCPLQMPLTEQALPAQSLAEVGSGWTSHAARTQHVLTNFAVNSGPPGTPNGEIYDKQEERKDGKGGATRTLSWNLQGMTGGVAICSYFRTRVELVRSLDGYSRCQVVYKRSHNTDFELSSASCQ
ncbi:STY0301 family protein [Roseateles depolymerans]|uniref:Uncharacterized protein n=1 Tax=Roseateles depolymerans TaxID=76731 RepID=A0A0U3LDY0_9BURK|nr:STY0301 family protein [Roseateles depolymerans]ALV04674.1 hypothetical protein RD2015_169 [Roseateles depolymerans]REG15317.1 hypothetical protein DES44_3825 [Roseateles depolymerans]